MRKMPLTLMCLLLTVAGCKKEKPFVEPAYVFAKWTRATETLNYRDYVSCEAYPKSEGVFREKFRYTYYSEMMPVEVGDAVERRDPHENGKGRYKKRTVQFECAEVRRRDRKHVRVLRGEVDFIRFLEGKNAKKGWLMWNRNIVRIDR
ncbi:MAG: hypothetical protein JW838_11375 [Spirochaetes bacterium]|nr:hypothetical protein [Spirochaetota bacterium]